MPRKNNFTTSTKGRDEKEYKNSYYRVTATIGKDADGKPLRKQFYGDSKKAAEEKREYMAAMKQGLSANFDKAIFGNVFRAWFEEIHRPSITLSTYSNYQTCYKLRIKDSSLSGLRLSDIKAIHMQAYYNGLINDGCGRSALDLTHKILTEFFNYCLKADLLVKSPMLAVELPPNKKRSETNKPKSSVPPCFFALSRMV